jgi:hypothetical protein
LTTGASAAGARSGGPFLFLGGFFLADAVAGASTGFSGTGIGEDGGFFLAGAMAGASTSFSGTGIGATAGTSAMGAGGAAEVAAAAA